MVRRQETEPSIWGVWPCLHTCGPVIRRLVMRAVLVATIALSVGGWHVATAQTVGELVDRVREREERTPAIRAEYTVVQTIPRGTMPVLDLASGWPMEGDFPKEDTKVEFVCRVLMSEYGVRAEREGPVWDDSIRDFVPARSKLAVTPGAYRELSEIIGRARVAEGATPQNIAYVLPLTCAYRLADPKWGLLDAERVRISGEGQIGDAQCVVIEQDEDRRGLPDHRRWWLAPEMGHSVLREEGIASDGQTRHKIDLRYEPAANTMWRLTGWSCAVGVSSLYDCSNMDVETNVELTPEDFDVRFPPGTRVYDERMDQHYVVDDTPGTDVDEPQVGDSMDAFVEKVAEETERPAPPVKPDPPRAARPDAERADDIPRQPAAAERIWSPWLFGGAIVAAAAAGLVAALYGKRRR